LNVDQRTSSRPDNPAQPAATTPTTSSADGVALVAKR
jgi:hypothetical protein